MGHQLTGVFQREGLDIHHLGNEAGRFDGRTALIYILRAGGNQQDIQHVGIGFRIAHDLEVVADFFHREGDVLIGLDLNLAFELILAEGLRQLDDLGDRGITADGNRHVARLAAGTLDRPAYRLTHGRSVNDGFLVDRVGWGRLGRVALGPTILRAPADLDQLDGGGRYVKSDQRF